MPGCVNSAMIVDDAGPYFAGEVPVDVRVRDRRAEAARSEDIVDDGRRLIRLVPFVCWLDVAFVHAVRGVARVPGKGGKSTK